MLNAKLVLSFSIIISLIYLPVSSAHSQSASAQIEVFDTEKGKVIQRRDNGTKIQEEMKKWLNCIEKTNTFGLNNATKYYLIKIPLISPLDIKLDYVMHGKINEIIIIVQKDKVLIEKHKLLLMDEENKPVLVELNKDISSFLKEINIVLN
ncbi:hypothetical protein IHV12_19780 [Fictibacillus sp. 7GRE50]|uniref:hypothetical protein n=1 Tax=Fictibacillus sp. 7GRE50 TaxID=2745878 RepID=UPI0018CF1A7F|nr:hypothetical protein [Fictibacillus sp. 7GRE50]MBH0167169.1 hypothetical protein [Fictibacillus sp. 7GRE50]